MRRVSLPSFDRSYAKLTEKDQYRVDSTIERFFQALDHQDLDAGLGLKKLTRNLWEVRAGLALRILFKFDTDLIIFAFVGDHDEVRRYLKMH